jgi:hypothetical protein
MSEFDAYKMYLALKAHFQTENYDVFKMKGRISASRKSFDGAGKELAFRRLVKLYKDEEVCNFMVANFITGNRWGGVFDVAAAREYADWQRRQQSLRYIFEQDLRQLYDEAADHAVTDIFAHEAGQHPLVLKAFLRRSITPETLIILNKLTGFAADIDLDTDPVWPDIHRLIVKYAPFIKIKMEPYQEIYHGFK